MTAEIVRFDLADAADALARSDEGHRPLPGDAELISAYEGYLQQEWDRYWRAQDEAEQAAWLAEQCPYCGPEGSTGPDCGDCPEGSEPR